MDKFVSKILVILAAVVIALTGFGMAIEKAPEEKDYSIDLTQQSVVKGRPFDPELVGFYKNSENAFTLPGLQQGFVPQGIFYSVENEIFLLSGYYKNSEKNGVSSRLCVLDKEGNFIKSVGVNGSKKHGHFGGVAVYKDYVYIANTGKTVVVSLEEVLAADNMASLDVLAELYTADVTNSYNNVVDGILYIGQYTDNTKQAKAASKFQDKDKHGKKYYAHCNGYRLDADGLFGFKQGKIVHKEGGKAYEYVITQDFAIATDLKVQGMVKLPSGKFAFSASANNFTNSNIYVYSDLLKRNPDTIIEAGCTEVPLYYCTAKDSVAKYKAPVFSEELALAEDGSVYLVCESAAAPYRFENKNPIDFCIKWNIEAMR